jgi:FlaA1/EpsC-like NDP-sugar epimerase
MIKYTRIALLLFADIICINIAYIMSFLLRFDFNFESDIFWGYFAVYGNNIFILTLIKLVIFWIFGLYRSLWRYAGTEELIRIVITSMTATAATIEISHGNA